MTNKLYDAGLKLTKPSANGGAWCDLDISFRNENDVCPSVKIGVEVPASGAITMDEIHTKAREQSIQLLKDALALLEQHDIDAILAAGIISAPDA